MSDPLWGLVGIGVGAIVSLLLLVFVGFPLLRREFDRDPDDHRTGA